MQQSLVVVLDRRTQPGWVAGPPSAPTTSTGETPPLARVLTVEAALRTAFTTDAHIQACHPAGIAPYVEGASSPTAGRCPRINREILRDPPDGVAFVATSAWVDLDRTGHGAWASPGEAATAQGYAVAALEEAGLPPSYVYATRAGLRVVYLLDEAVPVGQWGVYGRLLDRLDRLDWSPAGLAGPDRNCVDPGHLFRLPHVVRDGRPTAPPPMYAAPTARLTLTPGPADTYTFGLPARNPEALRAELPDEIPPRLSPFDPRWDRAGLQRFAGAPCLPTRAILEAAPHHPTWGGLGLEGFRSAVRYLVGRAVRSLARVLPAEEIPAEVYALLAPLAAACTGDPSTCPVGGKHPEHAEYVGALARLFASKIPDGPLLLQQARDSVYLLREDLEGGSYRYVEVPPVHLVTEIRRSHPDVEVDEPAPTRAEPSRTRPLSPAALYARHGALLRSRIWSYTDRTNYDRVTGTLTINVARPLEVEPAYSEEVDTWLRLAAGERYDALAESLATARMLDRPWAILWLPGAPGAGKQLVTLGLAALFEHGAPVAYYDATSRFNAGLLRTPIVALHEGVGKHGGDSRALRSLTTERHHRIEEKGVPAGLLSGFPRLVVDSNNPDPFGFAAEDLTDDDERAIGARINRVPFRAEAARYLADHGSFSFTDRWIEAAGLGKGGGPGVLCRHIAYLEQIREPRPPRRILAGGEAADWLGAITARRGLARDVLLHLAQIADGWTHRSGGALPWRDILADAVQWVPGAVLLRVAELREHWPTITGSRQAPHLDTFTDAVRKLREGPRRVIWPCRAGGPRRVRVHAIPIGRILDVCEAAGVEPETVEALVRGEGPDAPNLEPC